ncbi:hypothetical protein CANARDRAFT_30194 [[Candida] arabinofermentans NRRL YB-2248]|uniref:Phosphoribulokinase/uridine kinase domain-containing protein n=1 Tax=[Candida] arabinofermentans NRRL YB-2248 TaxID=983967 RepID=A0A1E4SV11_9ASCO|nr:hypothetical protein CANARDRAFT_30194 [[Candida] arabinofermentans NRRL YB-2248]
MSQGRTIVILIAGGHASGKSLVSSLVEKELKSRYSEIKVRCLDMAEFTRPVVAGGDERSPSRFDFQAITDKVIDLEKRGYDVIIVHGLYALYDKELKTIGTIKVFIDCDADVRLGRWIKRDILEPSKVDQSLKLQESSKMNSLLTEYLTVSRVEMNDFILPTKEYADVILPRGAEIAGITLIVDGIQPLIKLESESESVGSVYDTRTESSSSLQSFSRESASKVQSNLRHNNAGPTLGSINKDNFTSKNKRFYDLN